LRHDIQNAMTIIRARGEALADATEGRENDHARTVVNQSDAVISTVDRFRTLLRLLTEGELDPSPVELGPLIENRVDIARSTYPEADIAAVVPEGVTVLADETLENALGNLIGNAVEHNDTESPTVRISVSEGDRVATVRVADDGPGVPDDKKSTVFRRGNRGLKEADIGSGFGLFFVDTLIEGYDGSVTVEDNEPRGAVFVVRLRKAPAGDGAGG